MNSAPDLQSAVEGHAGPIGSENFLLIIGAMKAGTTSLYDHLSDHPQVCLSKTKETEFFCARSNKSYPETSLYHNLFDFDRSHHKIAVEASPGYSKLNRGEGVYERIKACGLHPKFVYILRNPFDRIESHVNYMRRLSPLTWDHDMVAPGVVASSDYILTLDRLLAVFERDRLLIKDFDDLRSDPLAFVNDVLGFCGLSPLERLSRTGPSNPTDYAISVSKMNKIAWLLKLQASIPGSLRPLLGPPKRLAKSILLRKNAGDHYIRMTPAERREVQRQLMPGMTRLRDEFGVDVARWGFG